MQFDRLHDNVRELFYSAIVAGFCCEGIKREGVFADVCERYDFAPGLAIEVFSVLWAYLYVVIVL